MERTLQDWQHEYRATPWEYPIGDNNRPATYDQFITLRDTLVFSNKYYADKAGRSLIIWTKLDWTPTDTIEIREPNLSKMSFEPWYESIPSNIEDETQWKYVTAGSTHTPNPLSCTINKDGRYRISHKEQFIDLDSAQCTRVHTIVRQHTDNQIISRAVFDWERAEVWDIIRLTSYGYVECDLHKWDWLELVKLDQDDNEISSAYLQSNSNWWSVEYIDLAYNK
jgi:hypothetical protein